MQPNLNKSVIIYIAIATLCILANVSAFIFQFFYYELPCPLCLLQRFGFIAIGFGATLSIIHRTSWKYDSIILISSIYTLVVAIRQILLHIAPNDLGYGSTFCGLHFYTWSAILSFSLILLMSMTTIIASTLNNFVILIDDQKLPYSNLDYKIFICNKSGFRVNIPISFFRYTGTVIEVIFLLITFINMIATYFECGFSNCPADPTTYLEWGKVLKLFKS
jgi:disulfide bond formation protein DsbB